MDCPFCGHSNTLSVSNDRGNLQWYCFSASCSARGKHQQKLDGSSIQHYLRVHDADHSVPFRLPDYFTSVFSSTECVNYLRKYNLIQPMQDGVFRAQYDPRQNRCVFLIPGVDGTCIAASGRALTYGVAPKWFKYGSVDHPWLLHRMGVGRCVLVEDAPSAIRIAASADALGCVSAALMGTRLSQQHIVSLLQHGIKEVVVALDNDATDKAIGLTRELSFYFKTRLVHLPADIKDLPADKVKELLA